MKTCVGQAGKRCTKYDLNLLTIMKKDGIL